MESYFDYHTETIVKLLASVILGSLIGVERARSGKTAGIRTHALVSMGATLFVVISLEVTEKYIGITMFDPLRVASHIIVGVGFIGGGMIFTQDAKVTGLTTAAGLWVAAGIGMAIGFGLYTVSIVVTILTLVIFVLLRYVESKFRH